MLIANPQVLLADEPGAGLDVRHRLDLLLRLQGLTSGRIVVVVMHDLEAAVRSCDRIVVFDNGRVALDGPSHAVAASLTLDKVFGVNFQRAPVNRDLGPFRTFHAARDESR